MKRLVQITTILERLFQISWKKYQKVPTSLFHFYLFITIFIGLFKCFCFTAIKNVYCPPGIFNMSTERGQYCEDNTFCQAGEVCCSNACIKKIYQNHCWYNNLFHTIGETNTTTKDVCIRCTCTNSGRSTLMECPNSNCKWGSNETGM